MSFQTVEDMQERLHNLCDEIDCLKYELEKAAADERAKIVAWLRAQNTTANLELEDDLAKDIEAGEHLK
jgi:hypothetical protein